MADRSFRPKVGRFGIMPVVASVAPGASPFTANTTTTLQIPTPPGKLTVLRAVAYATVVPADADGTLVATLVKRRASDNTDVTLTSTLDLEALTASEKSAFTFSTSITEADRILLEADILEVDVVSNSAAIDTQPTNFHVVVEFGYKE